MSRSYEDNDNVSLEIIRFQEAPLPRYRIELAKLPCSPEAKAELLSLYEGSIPRAFSKYVNKTVSLIGAIIWFRPPYQPNVEDKNAPVKPGYEVPLLLTDDFDEDQQPILIIGSQGLVNHVEAICSSHGWFIWPAPVRYTLKWAGTGKPFRMINQERVDSLLADKRNRQAGQ